MGERKGRKLNYIQEKLPEGLLVDSNWLTKNQISTALRHKYVQSGWLERPTRGVYRKPRGQLTWQQAIISLQTIILDDPIIVGGRTALELQGFSHYLQHKQTSVHLYSVEPLPIWLTKLDLGVRFVHHNAHKLFRDDPITYGLSSIQYDVRKNSGSNNDPLQRGLTYQAWGTWDWPLTLSTPERAILEMIDELPDRESFHQVDKLMEGLTNLSPRRLSKLLNDCKSVKVKRLFFYFADRHTHVWRRHLDVKTFDLGSGKRMLVEGGKLDPKYRITVPKDMNGV